jgi:predicted transcriptional regulator
MRLIIPAFLIVVLLFASCGEQKKSAKDLLKEKVMAVHDEIMPKMGDIMKYKKELNAKINELAQAGIEENAYEIEMLKKAVTDLDNSHDEMMGWMHQYNNDFEGMVEKEVMDYLNDQMKKIEDVAKTTNAALKSAEELLGS